ncbi:hypothetical protein KL909_005452, partial [Ogataea angusta]
MAEVLNADLSMYRPVTISINMGIKRKSIFLLSAISFFSSYSTLCATASFMARSTSVVIST